MKQRIDVKIEPDLLAEVDAARAVSGMTRTAVVEKGLRLFLEEQSRVEKGAKK